jgi:hypothetical protein
MRRFTKYFKDRRAIYYYLNKSVRNPALRVMLYKLVRCFVPKSTAPLPPEADLVRLQKDGIFIWDELLDAATVAKIHDYLLPKKVYDFLEDFKREGQTPLNLNEVDLTQQRKLKYFDKDIAACKEIVDLANSEKILSLVSAYLGCKPTIANMAAWWTKAGEVPSDKFYDDMFHRDVDDYKFIKLFVYLNDVSVENGAHCFVKGSHMSSECTQRRTFSDEEVTRHFGKENQLILTGKRGRGFLEDTWGLHRSMPCEKGERLVLHFLYSITSFNTQTTAKPVAKNVYGVDSYSNRMYLYE